MLEAIWTVQWRLQSELNMDSAYGNTVVSLSEYSSWLGGYGRMPRDYGRIAGASMNTVRIAMIKITVAINSFFILAPLLNY